MWLGAPGRPLNSAMRWRVRCGKGRSQPGNNLGAHRASRRGCQITNGGVRLGAGGDAFCAHRCRVCRERLTGRMHEAPIERTHKERLAGWGTVSR